MKIHDYSAESSTLSEYISRLRDINTQKDRHHFRRNIERVGRILGYEISKTLNYKKIDVTTPLGVKKCSVIDDEVVVCSILRAGLPLHNALLDVYDNAENTFISAYRRHDGSEEEFTIEVEYLASPSLEGKVLILADPMLATGSSIIAVSKALKKLGTPSHIHIMSVIGSTQAIETVKEYFSTIACDLWVATVDDALNPAKYIVPGLGDAGDLAFGEKL
ncbi:MAG: uracil phosphoribosyltransferase [Flavobacteriales bacterium]|nr:uracil phosphoribosyltransferase [Flavobacteriales bacterium]